MAEVWRLRPAWVMLAPAALAVSLLFGGALAGAVLTSFRPDPAGSLSAEAWRSVLGSPSFRDALVFSVEVTVAATSVSAALAVAAAALLRRSGTPVRALFSTPVLVPHLVVAVVAVLWVGPGGLADRILGGLPLQLVRDRAGLGIVLVYVYKEVPFLTLLVLAAWGRAVGRREEAAAVLGARPWQRMRWVVWPAIRAPLAIGSLIVAAFTFGAFEVPLVVGPTYPLTLPVLALQATKTAELAGRSRAAAILLVAAAGSIVLALAAAGRARRIDV